MNLNGSGNGDGTGGGPLPGWVVALAAGKTFLGRFSPFLSRTGNAGELDPVYELTVVQVQVPQQVQTPQGPAMQISLQPRRLIGKPSNFSSWTSLVLPPDAIIKPVSELALEEQNVLAGNVKEIETALEDLAKRERAAAMALEATQLKGFGGGPRSEES